MRTFLILAFALMVSCGCRADGIIEERVLSQDAVVPSYVEIAYQVMQEKVPCALQLTGNVYWFKSPLDGQSMMYCGQPAWGCADPWSCEFAVWIATYNPIAQSYIANVWETALVNEVGYWVWDKCYSRMPEHYYQDASGAWHETLDPDFATWIAEVNAETKRRAYALVYSGQNP